MNEKEQMDAILTHGMGRTPMAMSILAARLRRSGIRPHLFGYSVTFERRNDCFQRLEYFITKRVKTNEFIMIGHSLGTGGTTGAGYLEGTLSKHYAFREITEVANALKEKVSFNL